MIYFFSFLNFSFVFLGYKMIICEWNPNTLSFFFKLLLLFQFCHACEADKSLIEGREVGTLAVDTTRCQNPKCPEKEKVWYSQPYMLGTKIPAGNFLLCFAILLPGGSASNVIKIFNHMGLACISLSTFFQHQRVSKFNSYVNQRILLHHLLLETAIQYTM